MTADLDYIVEIRSPGEGSGLLVAPDLILTSWHVLRPREGEPFPTQATVRILRDYKRAKPGEPAKVRGARIIWPLVEVDDDHDFALLQLDNVLPEERAGAAVVWAELPESGVIDVQVIGFPDFGTFTHRANDLDKPVEERDTVLLEGRVATGTGVKQRMVYGRGTFDIAPRQEDLPAGSHLGWEGVSGAPVFAGDLLVGVVRVAAEDSRKLHRLRALPVARLFANEAVHAALRHARVVDVPPRGFVAATGQGAASFAKGLLDRFGVARDAPGDFRTGINLFLSGYLGTSDQPVAFGGRGVALDALDRWLDDPRSPSRLLLHALGGRGKSALVVHWLAQAASRSRLIFLPISVRSGTNQPRLFYQAMAERLAEILHTPVPAPVVDEPVGHYRRHAIDMLAHVGSIGKPVLLVIDGLDEAAGWHLPATLLPPMPHPGLRVLVSARARKAGAAGAQGWLDALGWSGGRSPPKTLEVQPLNVEGVKDVLNNVQLQLSDGESEQVWVLSAGDPLIVQLYAQELGREEGRGRLLRQGGLVALKPGLDQFFRYWLTDQKALWALKHPPLDPSEPYMLLALLACALGPLRYDELAAVYRRRRGESFTLSLEAIDAIDRFVQGDGRTSGYVLTHPRFGDYLRDEYFADPEILRRSREAFLRWGEGTLEAGRGQMRAPVSRYVVTYLGQHFVNAGAPAETFMRLVEREWGEIWYGLEGSYRGFLHDVRRAAEAVEVSAASDDRRWPWRLRCQLIMSSVTSLGARIPGALVVACVEAGRLTARQGLYWLQQGVPPARSGFDLSEFDAEIRLGSALGALGRIWPHDGDQQDGLRELLRVTAILPNHWPRSIALRGTVAHLPDLLMDDALRVAMTIRIDEYRAAALEDILPRTSVRTRADALRELLLAPHPTSLRDASKSIDAVARSLPANTLLATLDPAGGALPEERQVEFVARLQAAQVTYLPESAAAVLTSAMATEDEADRATLLDALALCLPEPLLGAALDAALTIATPASRWTALSSLVSRLSGDLLTAAMRHVLTWETPAERALALGAIASRIFDESARAGTIAKATEAVDAASDDKRMRPLLSRLTTLVVSEEERVALMSRWLRAVESQESVLDRSNALQFDTVRLPPQLLAQALSLVASIENEFSRARALIKLAPDISPELMPQALTLATAFRSEIQRGEAIAALAPRLPATLVREALEAVRPIVDMGGGIGLMSLVERLPMDLLDRAFDLARRIPGDEERRAVVALLAARLPVSALQDVLRGMCGDFDNYDTRSTMVDLILAVPEPLAPLMLELLRPVIAKTPSASSLLRAAASKVSGSLLDQAVALAHQLQSDSDRARTLAEIGVRLDVGPERDALLADVLRALGTMTFNLDAAETLELLCPHLPPSLMEPFLARVETLSSPEERAQLLCRVSANLPSHLMARAWAAALAIVAPAPRAQALAVIAAQFAEPSVRAEALEVALKSFLRVGDEAQLSRAIASLVPRIAPGPERAAAIDEGLRLARTLLDDQVRIVSLRRFAPWRPAVLGEMLQSTADWRWEPTAHALADGLDAQERKELLLALAQMPDERRRVGALLALVNVLPEASRGEFLQLGLNVDDERARADFLRNAAPHFGPALIGRALKVADRLTSSFQRSWARDGLKAHRPRSLLDKLLQRRLPVDAAAKIKADLVKSEGLNDVYQAHALIDLAPSVPDSLASHALRNVSNIRMPHWRANVLKALAPVLSAERWAEALQIISAIEMGNVRGDTIGDIASSIPTALHLEVLALIEAIDDSSGFVSAISGLAEVLNPELLQQAIAMASARHLLGEAKVRAMSSLGGRLSPGDKRDTLFSDTVGVALTLAEPKNRLRALRHLLPHVTGPMRERVVVGLLQAAGRLPRAYLLETVPELIESVSGYSDERGALSVYEAVRDAGAWFP